MLEFERVGSLEFGERGSGVRDTWQVVSSLSSTTKARGRSVRTNCLFRITWGSLLEDGPQDSTTAINLAPTLGTQVLGYLSGQCVDDVHLPRGDTALSLLRL